MVRKNSRKMLVQYVLGEERMKEKRVTLGSILQMDEQMGMVIGFRIGEKGGHLHICCVVVPYPFGYLSDEETALIPVSGVKVVKEGYLTDYSEKLFKNLDGLEECFRHMSVQEGRETLKEVLDWAESEGEKANE